MGDAGEISSVDRPNPSGMRLGIDFGGVIIPHDRERFINCEPEDVVALDPFPFALETITALAARLGGRVWIISKAGWDTQERTRLWLEHHEFHGRTKIPPDNLRFCDTHHDKRGICVELGITDMIDDRFQVHEALSGVVARRYLFGDRRDEGAPNDLGLIAVSDWTALDALLLGRQG